MNYKNCRDKIFQHIKEERVFTWDHMYGQEYALASVYTLSHADRAELTYATEQLGCIYAKTITALQRGSNELLMELGIPHAALDAVRVSVLPAIPTTIGRFDFAHTKEGWKVIEFNSDTPGGIVEAYYLNGKICEYYGYNDINSGLVKHIAAAFGRIYTEYQSLGYNTEHIAFSSLEWHEEDSGTARFLMQCSGLKSRFVPLKDLRIYQDRLWSVNTEPAKQSLEPIDVLYRLHPLGIISEETDKDGYPTGAHLLDLIARRKLALINPPGALLSQTKGLQALIWLLHEAQELFEPHEHEIISTYMLPTYLNNRFGDGTSYVIKPMLGREGGGITIINANGQVEDQDVNASFANQKQIFQQYAELEQTSIETLQGNYQGFVIWGSFLVNGQASAINARIGGRITNDLSYFLPVRLV